MGSLERRQGLPVEEIDSITKTHKWLETDPGQGDTEHGRTKTVGRRSVESSVAKGQGEGQHDRQPKEDNGTRT